jgi:hypothetical protein
MLLTSILISKMIRIMLLSIYRYAGVQIFILTGIDLAMGVTYTKTAELLASEWLTIAVRR